MAFQFNQGDRPLPGYTVQRGIGRGGFGEVYYAVSDGGKDVALKYLRENPQVELRGVQHCLNLKSPYLVAIHDVKQNAGGDFFVIMEYVNGLSLRDLMNQEPKGLGQQKAAYFLREIGKGLAYLHDRGIVHRDLKPGNIFYEDGYVKIGDYGLSKLMAASQHSGQTVSVGTVHYMAPEVGSGNYDKTIDIYALGVMLYEMLLGRVPFSGSSMGEVLMKHLTAQPEVDELPAPFPQVIRKALAKDPRDRYQSVEEMVADIFSVEDLDRTVAAFEPASLNTLAARAAAKVRTAEHGVAAFGTGSSNAGGITPPPPIIASPPAAGGRGPRAFAGAAVMLDHVESQQATAAVNNEVALPYGGWVGDPSAVGPAVIGALSATAAAAVTATVVNHPGGDTLQYAVGVFLHGFGILQAAWVWQWWTSRYLKSRDDWTGTLTFAGVAGVLFMLINRMCIEGGLVPPEARHWLAPMLAAFVLCDWRKRLSDGGRGIVSIGPAFAVALFGFIAGQIGSHDDWVPVAAMLAGASLSLQMLGRIWPRAQATMNGKSRGKAGTDAPYDTPRPYPGAGGSGPQVVLSRDAATNADAGPHLFAEVTAGFGGNPTVARFGTDPAAAERVTMLEPRSPMARTAMGILAVVFLIAATLAYSIPMISNMSSDNVAAGIVVGLVMTCAFMFCFVSAIPKYRHGWWRSYVRQALFFAGAAMSSAAGASLGLLELGPDGSAAAMTFAIIGGALALGVWFIPVPAYQPVSVRAKALDGDYDPRRGLWQRVVGISLLAIGLILTPILLLSLSPRDFEEVLPPTLIPIGVLGVVFTAIGFTLPRQRVPSRDRASVRLELPLRRDFRVTSIERLESNLDRHAVIFDYTPRRKGDLIWSYQRGDWMAHLIQSDIRKWKATFTVAVYDMPDGDYRVSCLLDLDAPWNKPGRSMLRKLDEELTIFGETIGAVELSRVPVEVLQS